MDRELWLRLTERYGIVRAPIVFAIDRHHDQRKSYTRPDLYERDLRLLVEEYGVPPLGKARCRLKIAKIGLRMAGVPLALRASVRQGAACEMKETRSGPLLLRQMLLPRRMMPR
jgi:hypothetical protein